MSKITHSVNFIIEFTLFTNSTGDILEKTYWGQLTKRKLKHIKYKNYQIEFFNSF